MFFGKVFSIIDSLKMLDIQGMIYHGKFIHDLIKPNMGGKFDSVGINIIVEHISVGMWIISKEYPFGNMVIKPGFYLYTWLHIDITFKGPKGGEVILLACTFLN